MKRECGTCTKCCDGNLFGEALGHTFFKGKPCHFVMTGQGCSVYAKRPKDPCVTYKCEWLVNPDIPEWMKPNLINTIIDKRKTNNGIEYLNVVEAGEPLRANVLSLLILHCLSNQMNMVWEVDGGRHWIGSPEFVQDLNNLSNITNS